VGNRPTSAFVSSLIGGAITLTTDLVTLHTWFFMYYNSGMTFTWSWWYVMGSVHFTALEALILFVIGAACGISILVGATLQYSSEEPRVRKGSLVVLVATILGIPTTYFGMIIGGLLSIIGAVQGISWKPLD
jgi:hypothetical protein